MLTIKNLRCWLQYFVSVFYWNGLDIWVSVKKQFSNSVSNSFSISIQTQSSISIKYKLKFANLISKLNFYKLIPYPMDNLLNRSAQTGPPNVRKRRPVFPPAGGSVVLCTPQMVPRTSFLSRQPDVIASFSLSKPLRPLVS